MARRIRIPVRMVACLAISGTVATGGVLAAVPGAAHAAAPAQSLTSRIASAKHELHVLAVRADAASERYDGAREKLGTAQTAAATAQRNLATSRAKVAELQKSVTAFAIAAYQGDSIDPLLALTDGTASTFVDRVSSLQAVSVDESQTLAQTKAAQRAEEQAQADASAALVAQRTATATMQAARNRVLASAAKQRTILQHLEAREVAIVRAAKQKTARLAAERAAARLRAQEAQTRQASRAVVNQPVYPTPVSGSGGASTAVAWAYREIGKPYVWGAAGPNSFDCSGLTMYVWARAGVSLGHYTGDQWNEGTHVSQSQLEPGDLVFFAYNTSDPSSIHHVGIYVGGGEMIDAPYTGVDVRKEPYDRSDYIGAVRP